MTSASPAEMVVRPEDVPDAVEVDASGLTVLFGLWDCHAHPGERMYDPSGQGYFRRKAGGRCRQATT